MYANLFKQFENAENLASKAWQHAVNIANELLNELLLFENTPNP